MPAPSCACAQALPPLTGRLQPHTWSLPTASAVLKASLQPPKQHTIEIFLGPSPRRGLPSTTPGLPPAPRNQVQTGLGGLFVSLHKANAAGSACSNQQKHLQKTEHQNHFGQSRKPGSHSLCNRPVSLQAFPCHQTSPSCIPPPCARFLTPPKPSEGHRRCSKRAACPGAERKGLRAPSRTRASVGRHGCWLRGAAKYTDKN